MSKCYIDGCSHTVGHRPIPGEVTKNTIWLGSLMQRYLAPDSFEESFYFPQTAKANDNMFFDFMSVVDQLVKGDKVFIYWSHAERFIRNLDITTFHDDWMHGQGICTKTVSPFRFGSKESQFGPLYKDLDYEQIVESWMYKTWMYMYSVQEICKQKELDWYFVTCDPFYKFDKIRDNIKTQCPIDYKHVWNWPADTMEMWPGYNVNEHNHFLVEWALTSTPILLGRAQGIMDGTNYISDDYKHITQKGHKMFSDLLIEWIEDPDRDLSWHINNRLTQKAALEYKSIMPHLKQFDLTDYNATHWVEQEVEKIVKKLNSAITYVYE